MDTLALLCNLHADGPATLQRLRRAGCESLAALRRMDPLRLAERLEWSERSAERFLREAALLSGRVEPEPDGGEDLEGSGFESELAEDFDGDTFSGATEELEDESEAEEEEEPELAADDTELVHTPSAQRVEVVLGAWRELDRVAPPSEPTPYEIPRPAPAPDRSLVTSGLAELSPRLVARFAELNVATLRELVEASELELARTLPLGFTRVKHLRFLAERELERLPPDAGPASGVPTFESFTPPAREPFETAGPFA